MASLWHRGRAQVSTWVSLCLLAPPPASYLPWARRRLPWGLMQHPALATVASGWDGEDVCLHRGSSFCGSLESTLRLRAGGRGLLVVFLPRCRPHGRMSLGVLGRGV